MTEKGGSAKFKGRTHNKKDQVPGKVAGASSKKIVGGGKNNSRKRSDTPA